MSDRADVQTQDGFELHLRTLGYTGRRVFPTPTGDSGRGQSASSLQIELLLADSTERRVFRVKDASLTSVLTSSGRQLIASPSAPNLRRADGYTGRPRFVVSGFRQDGSGTSTVQVMVADLRTNVPPSGLAELAGFAVVEYATSDATVEVALASGPGEPAASEVAPGITASARVFEVDPANKGMPPRVTLELTGAAPRGADGGSIPIVQSIELIDDRGAAMGQLVRRDEALVGEQWRARFTNDAQAGFSQRGSMSGGTPKLARLWLLTQTRSLRIPFRWGPLNLVDDPNSGN